MIKNVYYLYLNETYKKKVLEDVYTFIELAKVELKENECIKVVINGNMYISKDVYELLREIEKKEPSKSIIKAMNKPVWKVSK